VKNKNIMHITKFFKATVFLALFIFATSFVSTFAGGSGPGPTGTGGSGPGPTSPGGFSFADGTLTDLLYAVIGLFNPIIILLAGIAVVVFMWGVIKYINASGDPKRLKEGSKYLLFGILAFVVIVGLWGIVKTVTSLLGLEFAGPQFKTSRSSTTGSAVAPAPASGFGSAQFTNQTVQTGTGVSGKTGYGTTQTTSGTGVSGATGYGTTQTTSGTGVSGGSGYGTTQTTSGTAGSGSTGNTGQTTDPGTPTGGGTTNTTGN
jgi:hypothetical protein